MGFFKDNAQSLIGGSFGIIGQGIQAAIDSGKERRAEERQIAAEKREQEYQIAAEKRALGYQKDLMDYENEYNDPKNQMKRLQDAGLNPYLADGVSAGTSSTGSGAIGAEAPSAEASETYNRDYASAVAESIQSGMAQDMARNLQHKQMELQKLQIDAQVAQIYAGMDMDAIKFQYQQKRDSINDTYRDKEFEIKNQQLSIEAKRAALDELRTKKDLELKSADQEFQHQMALRRDERDKEAHEKSMKLRGIEIKNARLEHKMKKIAWEDMSDSELRKAKKDLVLIERNIAKMDEDTKTAYFERLDKTIELFDLMQSNQISREEYIDRMRSNWLSTEGNLWHLQERYLNPYTLNSDTAVLDMLANIATFAFTKGKVK